MFNQNINAKCNACYKCINIFENGPKGKEKKIEFYILYFIFKKKK